VLRKHELERALDAGERPAEIVDDLCGEVRFGLLGLTLFGDVFEPQGDRGGAELLHRANEIDAIRASGDFDVDGSLLVTGKKKSLQPPALTGDGARRFLNPWRRSGAERPLERLVAPLDAAVVVDDRDRRLQMLGDRIAAADIWCGRHDGIVIARSFSSFARLNSVVNR